MNRLLHLTIFFAIGIPGLAFAAGEASSQSGIRLGLSTGAPQSRILTDGLDAKYSGFSIQGDLLFPLMSSGIFSMDLDASYILESLENNASNGVQTEWAQTNGFGTGLRFRLSYLQTGIDYMFLRSQHLKAGTSNEIYEYNYSPLKWYVGIHIPLSPVTSFGVTYSQTIEKNLRVEDTEINVSSQAIWVNIQIDFGVSFLNLLKVEESFESTRSSFLFEPTR